MLLLAAPSRYLCSLHLAKLNASLSINFSSLLQETAPFSPRGQSGELDSTVSLSLAGHVHTLFSPLVILLHYFKNPRRSCDFLWPVYSQVLTQYPMRQITVDCPKRTTKNAVAVGFGRQQTPSGNSGPLKVHFWLAFYPSCRVEIVTPAPLTSLDETIHSRIPSCFHPSPTACRAPEFCATSDPGPVRKKKKDASDVPKGVYIIYARTGYEQVLGDARPETLDDSDLLIA